MASAPLLTPLIGRVPSAVETAQPVFAALGGGAALGAFCDSRGSSSEMIRSSTALRRWDRSGVR